jgi:hypothetical protein
MEYGNSNVRICYDNRWVNASGFDLMKDCDVRELVVPCNEAIQINDTNGCFD